ncbi:hypothetical protein [Flavobacterium sp.]|uniref:hypothetical protein n=1 Tax=Flavobacterium sp. TaxID=239 RepID=UPI0026390A3C|nr:hypothetical protein [Flavobacterium sp.]
MRKFILLLGIIASCLSSFAQPYRGISEDSIPYVNNFRMRILKPVAFGDNAISKDTDQNFGFGANLTLVNFKKFHFVAGAEVLSYSVTNSQFLGRFKTIQEARLTMQVEYEAYIKKQWRLIPLVGLAYSSFDNYKPRTGEYRGNSYFIGGIVNYGFNRDYSVSFGLNYLYAKYSIDAIASQQSYLDSSHQLVFSLSLNFR